MSAFRGSPYSPSPLCWPLAFGPVRANPAWTALGASPLAACCWVPLWYRLPRRHPRRQRPRSDIAVSGPRGFTKLNAMGVGTYDFSGGVTAQLNYSPTLKLLARIGDAIAKEHNDQLRAEERAFAEQLFGAFVADYNQARPGREGECN